MSARITLTDAELHVCRIVAQLRHTSNRQAQVCDRQRGRQDKQVIDMDGMVAEFAFAKLANLCPDFTVSVRSGGADLVTRTGLSVDVKATRWPRGQLLGEVKKKSHPCDLYVLMVVDDNSAQFAGWAYGSMLFDDANLTDLGHGPTYALPQERLCMRLAR